MVRKTKEPNIYVVTVDKPLEFISRIQENLKEKNFKEHSLSGTFLGKNIEEAKYLLFGFAQYFEKGKILVVSEIYEIQKNKNTYAVILKISEIAGYEVREIGEGQRIVATKLDVPHIIIISQKRNTIKYSLLVNKNDKNVSSLGGAWTLILRKSAATAKEEKIFIEKLQALGKQKFAVKIRGEIKPEKLLDKLCALS